MISVLHSDLFRYSPDVAEAFPEDDKHAFRAAAQSGSGAIEGSVASSQHDDVAVQCWQATGACAHAGFTCRRHKRKEVFGSVEALLLCQTFEHGDAFRVRHPNSNKHRLKTSLLQVLQSQTSLCGAQRLAQLNLKIDLFSFICDELFC